MQSGIGAAPAPKTFDGRDLNLMDEQQREQLRAEHKLRPVKSEEEGTAITKLPNGVYGFTYAPATETPRDCQPHRPSSWIVV